MKFKKFLALVLAVSMVFAIAGCGCGKGDDSATDAATEAVAEEEVAGYPLVNDESVPLGTPEVALDPEAIYESIEYIPEMFYGEYILEGEEQGEEALLEEVSLVEWEDYVLTSVPISVSAGPDSTYSDFYKADGYYLMEAEYLTGRGYTEYLDFLYYVDGNTILLQGVESYEYDEITNNITYELNDIVYEYEFEFKGFTLTLTDGVDSVKLRADIPYYDKVYLYASGYAKTDSDMIDDIEYIRVDYDEEDNYSSFRVDGEDVDYVAWNTCVGSMAENGLLTFTVPWEIGEKTYQYVFFYLGYDGLLLTDGENVYEYTLSYSEKYSDELDSFTDATETITLDDLTDEQVEEIVETKNSLLTDLTEAFAAEGIEVTVDEETGEMAVDASILFGGDSAVISDSGKEFLNKFISAYTSVVFEEEYEGFISKTLVEGHTALLEGSTYESGLPLSQERATNVANYCLSAESGISDEHATALSGTMEAVGKSNSVPIYDANGNVDKEASRRVSFRFIIDLSSVQ